MKDSNLTELVVSLKGGDKSVFKDIYDIINDDMWHMALSVMKEEYDARDLLQQTYLEILAGIDRLRDEKAFFSWAKSILYNLAYNEFRERRRFENIEYDDAINIYVQRSRCNDNAPEEFVWRNELAIIIDEALGKLSDEQAAIMTAVYYDQKPLKQVAGMFGLPLGTVKSNLFYSRKKMKASLNSYEKRNNVKLRKLFLPLGVAGASLGAGVVTGGKVAAVAATVMIAAGVGYLSLSTPESPKAEEPVSPPKVERVARVEEPAPEKSEPKKVAQVSTEEKPKSEVKTQDNSKYWMDEGISMRAKRGDDGHKSVYDGPYNWIDANQVITDIPYGTSGIYGTVMGGGKISFRLGEKEYKAEITQGEEYAIDGIEFTPVGTKFKLYIESGNGYYETTGKVVASAIADASMKEGALIVKVKYTSPGDVVKITCGEVIKEIPIDKYTGSEFEEIFNEPFEKLPEEVVTIEILNSFQQVMYSRQVK